MKIVPPAGGMLQPALKSEVLERAVRWLVENMGADVELDCLQWDESRPTFWRARCRVGDSGWAWTDIPLDEVAP